MVHAPASMQGVIFKKGVSTFNTQAGNEKGTTGAGGAGLPGLPGKSRSLQDILISGGQSPDSGVGGVLYTSHTTPAVQAMMIMTSRTALQISSLNRMLIEREVPIRSLIIPIISEIAKNIINPANIPRITPAIILIGAGFGISTVMVPLFNAFIYRDSHFT